MNAANLNDRNGPPLSVTKIFKWAAAGKDASDHIAAQLPLSELVDPPNGFPYENDEVPQEEPPSTNGSTPPERRLRLTKASTIRMRAVQWMWEEGDSKWLALGSLGLLAGREGVGKSTIAYKIAAQVTRGELPGDLCGKPMSVAVVATEDAWSQSIIPKLVAAGADLDRCSGLTPSTKQESKVSSPYPRHRRTAASHSARERSGSSYSTPSCQRSVVSTR